MRIQYLLVLRQSIRHPWQVILSVLGIALSVSVVLAIDLTNASAERAFEISSQSIVGNYSHQITGGSFDIDESVYVELRNRFGLRTLAPIVEGRIRTTDNKLFQLVGMDLVAMMGSAWVQGGGGLKFAGSPFSLLGNPGSVYVSKDIQQQLGVDIPADLEFLVNGRVNSLKVVGIIPARGDLQSQALQSTIVGDIATAQIALDMIGKLSRIDLLLNAAELELVEKNLKPPLQLIQSSTRGNALDQMTKAFRINLVALSLLALVIGAFLIYNTMTVSVLQRRDQIATMRTLGLSRKELISIIMGEAMLLAIVGTLLGYAMGIALSHVLIKLASRTLSDLYFVNEVRHIYFNNWSFIKACALGLGATLIASWLPCRDALCIAPELTRSRSRLEQYSKAQHKGSIITSVICALVAVLIFWFTDKSIVAGFGGLFLIIMSFALLTPSLLVILINLIKPLMTVMSGLTGSIASHGVLSSLSRTQVAVAALAVAISATIGVSIMIGSFRHSVEVWLNDFLNADIYVSQMDNNGRGGMMDNKLIENLQSLPEVRSLGSRHWRQFWQDESLLRLFVVGMDEQIFSHYRFKNGGGSQRWSKFSKSDSVIISEPYAYHHKLDEGDSVSLPTDKGNKQFEIVGVYTDYSSESGVISMYRDTYTRSWQDKGISSVALYLSQDANIETLLGELKKGVFAEAGLRARVVRNIRDMSMRIFDRTFAITEVLRVLTIIIAITGIFGALLAIQLERSREFAVLRATGLTPADLRKLILSESGLMGTVAGIIAIPLGIMLATVLIYVINRRSFGWSMEIMLEPQYLLGSIGLGLFAGLLAGIYPAWRMASTSPAIALRNE